MLEIPQASRVFFVSGFTDMRCGRYTLANIVRFKLGMDPFDGSAYAFMSRDRRKMKLLVYRNHMYFLYDLAYDTGFRFLAPTRSDGAEMGPVEEVPRAHMEALLTCPARTRLPI